MKMALRLFEPYFVAKKDQKDYHKSSLGLITNPHLIDNSEKDWLLSHL